MTEEVRTGWRSSAEAEARRERRRKGDGKAPWQPIVLPDDDDEQPAPGLAAPPRPATQVGFQ
jgi:hypothetical protein